jgi:hypothetical protein
MPHAEHPLVPSHRSDTPTHLVGKRLKGEPMVCRRERAGDRVTGTSRRLGSQEALDCFLKPTLQEVLKPDKWD